MLLDPAPPRSGPTAGRTPPSLLCAMPYQALPSPPPRGTPKPPPFALGQAAHSLRSSAIAVRRELSPRSPPHRPLGNSFPNKDPPRSPHFHLSLDVENSATAGILHRFTGSGDPLGPLSVPQETLVRYESHGPILLCRRPLELPCRASPSTASAAFLHHPIGNAPR
jgi:hypothetical protein